MTHKDGVYPIAKPVKREKAARGLSRKSQMERKPSKLKKTPLGHASAEQREKVEREGPRITWELLPEHTVRLAEERLWFARGGLTPVDPAHVTPRAVGGCDDPLCVIGLPRVLHLLYDAGELDILPHLTHDEQAHAVSHLGILGALKRTTGENYVPERAA